MDRENPGNCIESVEGHESLRVYIEIASSECDKENTLILPYGSGYDASKDIGMTIYFGHHILEYIVGLKEAREYVRLGDKDKKLSMWNKWQIGFRMFVV